MKAPPKRPAGSPAGRPKARAKARPAAARPKTQNPKRKPASVGEALERLSATYPDARCSLDFESPLHLLVATILSAQCTDTRVNMVTPSVFARFPDATSLATAPAGELEELIRSTGFFNAKARSIREAARRLVAHHGGEVPKTMAELKDLPGVGRKTANVVLGNVWGTPDGVVVDTHVGRLARRLGWTREADPEKVEQDLNRLIPNDRWVWVSHALIHHGRAVCLARKPRCSICPIGDLCPRVGVEDREAAMGKTS